MSKELDIANCPYCPDDGLQELSTDNFYEVVHCSGCGATGPHGDTIQRSIVLWNQVANRSVRLPKKKKGTGFLNQFTPDEYGYNQAIEDFKKLNPHLKFEE